MAGYLAFEARSDDGLWTYHYAAGGEPLIRSGWTPADFAPGTSLAYREDMALYLGLIWRITDGLMVYAVPRYERVSGMYAAGEPYALVRWEHDVAIEEFDRARTGGFVPARSNVRSWPPPAPWQSENAARAGLFEVPVFSILEAMFQGVLNDAWAELNIYALSSQSSTDRILAALQGRDTPDLRTCMTRNDIVIHLGVGVDSRGDDVIVIYSLKDIGRRLQKLTKEYARAILAYQADVPGLRTNDEWRERVATMLGLGAAEHSRWAGWS